MSRKMDSLTWQANMTAPFLTKEFFSALLPCDYYQSTGTPRANYFGCQKRLAGAVKEEDWEQTCLADGLLIKRRIRYHNDWPTEGAEFCQGLINWGGKKCPNPLNAAQCWQRPSIKGVKWWRKVKARQGKMRNVIQNADVNFSRNEKKK